MPVISYLSGPKPFLFAAILGGWLALRSGRTGRRFIRSSGLVALCGVVALFACLTLAGVIDASDSGGSWYQSTFVTEQVQPTVYRGAVLIVVVGVLHLLGHLTRAKRSKVE
jgi:hypothetical protein